MFPVNIAKFLRIAFSGCFWQSYHGTVKSAGVPVLWFRASTCFQFWSKTFTKRCTNNSLLSRDKSFLLSWIDWSRAFDFRICFGKTLIASDFDKKLTQSVAQVTMCNITCQKIFFSCTLRLIRCSQFHGMICKGRTPCKQNDHFKSITVKIPILILFRFCLLCWLKNHLFCVLSLL